MQWHYVERGTNLATSRLIGITSCGVGDQLRDRNRLNSSELKKSSIPDGTDMFRFRWKENATGQQRVLKSEADRNMKLKFRSTDTPSMTLGKTRIAVMPILSVLLKLRSAFLDAMISPRHLAVT